MSNTKKSVKKTCKRVSVAMNVDDEELNDTIARMRQLGTNAKVKIDKKADKDDEWGEEGVDWWYENDEKDDGWGEEGVDWFWEYEDVIEDSVPVVAATPRAILSPQERTLSIMVNTGNVTRVQGQGFFPVAHHHDNDSILFTVRHDGRAIPLSLSQSKNIQSATHHL